MEDRLRKSGLGLSIGFLGLLVLFGVSVSYAKSSFRNTPLYRHLVRGSSSQPVRLYEDKPAASGEQAKVAEKSSDERITAVSNEKPAVQVSPMQLEKRVIVPAARMRPANLTDPSTLTRDMPLSEAIEILRNCTVPKLNISVLWKDLEENADIYPETPIGVDGVAGVSLSRHLKSLVDGVSGGAPEKLGYVVEDGVIVIATLPSLPHRMVTRVYDITDLVGQPSTGFPPMGIMGMGMPGMMGMQGGMMGGMMPGMGGLMPGYGGGFGNFGGGYNNFGSGFGNFGSGYGNFSGANNISQGLVGTLNAPYRSLR